MTKFPASTGWIWLKQGFALCRRQPALLTTLMFANIFVSLLIGSVPILGPLVAVVLMPSLSMAVLQACLLIEQGQRPTVAVWMTGFRKPALITLCKVGLAYLIVSLLLTLLMSVIISPEFWRAVAEQSRGGEPAQLASSDLLAMLSVLALNVIALVALNFAGPLALWQSMPPAKAVFYSVYAVKRSAGVFFIMLAAWLGIFLGLAMLIVLVLGGSGIARVIVMWLIFISMLVLQCAMFVGYREIFGLPHGHKATVDLSK